MKEQCAPVPADIGDASPPAGLFSSIADAESLPVCFWGWLYLRHKRQTATMRMATNARLPTMAPAITAPEGLEPLFGDGVFEASKMFKALKYSY